MCGAGYRPCEAGQRAPVKGAYTDHGTAAAAAATRAAWDLATFANRVFQAVIYEAVNRSREDASRWEMAGVVARTLEDRADLRGAS